MYVSPPLEAHRLLSDGRSTALVTHRAEIDWWCWPRMHAAPVCWSLLDPCGGFARWHGVEYVSARGGAAGPTARTTLRLGSGRIEVWDGLVGCGASSDLVRLVRNLDTDLDIEHELRVGGFDAPPARWSGSTASLGDDLALTVSGGDTSTADGIAYTRVRAPRATWAVLSIAAHAEPHDPQHLTLRLGETETEFQSRLSTGAVPRQHAE